MKTAFTVAAGDISLPRDWPAVEAVYRACVETELLTSLLPFWQRTLDRERGGVFNCWNNAGTQLVSRDKFTWSQGRFAWLWSRVAGDMRRGVLAGEVESDEFLAQAERTVDFLLRHAFLPDGRCVSLVAEDGALREVAPGAGPAASIYADCFALMGLAEFARVAGRRDVLERAWELFLSVEMRLRAGGFPTHPAPIPAGHTSLSIAMITLNVLIVLEDACAELGDARTAEVHERTVRAAAAILDGFMEPGGRLCELRPERDGNGSMDTLLLRHVNPGHSLEVLWLVLTVAAREGRQDWIARASEAVNYAFRVGWDPAHGGLLYYVDREGGAPCGVAGESACEQAVRKSWDAKLWWVHSEAIYTGLLAYRLTGDAETRQWFERVFAYTWRTFPNPDRAVGEWIQIRDREGRPLERVVALPVKDPYHIVRNLLQVLELFSSCNPTSRS